MKECSHSLYGPPYTQYCQNFCNHLSSGTSKPPHMCNMGERGVHIYLIRIFCLREKVRSFIYYKR